MSIRERLSGNEATAIAMKQINPDVVAAFPITPSTEIPQYFSTFDAKRTMLTLYKMDNAACGRTAFAFDPYTNDCEYWRKILEASAM